MADEMGLIKGRTRGILVFGAPKIDSGAHPASYSMGTVAVSPAIR